MQKCDCPICKCHSDFWYAFGGAGSIIVCPRCGEFEISNIAKNEISNWTNEQKVNLSGWVRENQKFEIGVKNLGDLRILQTPNVGEKAEKILLRLASLFPKPGENLDLSGAAYSECLGFGRVADLDEMNFLMLEYLHREKGYLLMSQITTNLGVDRTYKISPKGWAYIDSLRQRNVNSQIGFIAMWFDKSVDLAWLAIEAGIQNAGFEPMRIDRKEHNNKIDDEIIAGIRRSRFLVADFTGQRGGVYFEAGFAMGLGIPVIWTCREDQLKEVHFDTRQYNHIAWTVEKLPAFTSALGKRIEAIIGRGPLVQKIP